jgi:hypothetical protein
MRRRALLLLIATVLGPGCAGRWLVDRGRDLQDVITVQAGLGLGAKARLSCLQTGFLFDLPLAGLKGGGWGWYPDDGDDGNVFDVQLVLLGFEFHVPATTLPARAKGYEAYPVLPFVQLPRQSHAGGALCYYTQLEVALGAGPSLRLGVNPGEVVDLLAGLVGLDPYGDDVVPEELITRF